MADVLRDRLGAALRPRAAAGVRAQLGAVLPQGQRLGADVRAGVRRRRAAAAQRRAGGQRDRRRPGSRTSSAPVRRRSSPWRRARRSSTATSARSGCRSTSGGSPPACSRSATSRSRRCGRAATAGNRSTTRSTRWCDAACRTGLTFNASYTLSTAKDQAGVRQNSTTAPSIGIRSRYRLRPVGLRSAAHLQPHERVRPAVRPAGRSAVGAHRRLVCRRHLLGDERHPARRLPAHRRLRRRARVHGLRRRDSQRRRRSQRRHRSRASTGSNGIGTSGNPATGGTGVNMFENPEQVFNDYRRVLVSQDDRAGRGTLRGLPRWNLDLAIGKRVRFGGIGQRHGHRRDRQPLQHAAVQQRQPEPGAARPTSA